MLTCQSCVQRTNCTTAVLQTSVSTCLLLPDQVAVCCGVPLQCGLTLSCGIALVMASKHFDVQSGVGKVFSALLGPTLPPPPDATTASCSSQQPQSSTQAPISGHMASAMPSSSAAAHDPSSDLSTAVPQVPESVVYNPGTIGSGSNGQTPTQQVEPLLILPDLMSVLQWRQECIQQMASQCCVHESVASLLLDRHQGNADRAYKSWENSHQGIACPD